MVPVPSLFFIGENGTPLEIVAGSATAAELASKIDNVLTKAGKSNKQSSLNLIDAEQKATAASSSSSNNNIEITMSNVNDNNSNPNADLTSDITESVTPVNISNNENNVTEDTTKAVNTGNEDNNEASAKANAETKQDNQNKELTAEVCGLSKIDIIFEQQTIFVIHFRKRSKEHDS